MSPGHLNREKILTIFRAGLFSIAIPDVKDTLRCCQKKNVLGCDFQGNKLISAKRHGCPLAQHPCVGEKRVEFGAKWMRRPRPHPTSVKHIQVTTLIWCPQFFQCFLEGVWNFSSIWCMKGKPLWLREGNEKKQKKSKEFSNKGILVNEKQKNALILQPGKEPRGDRRKHLWEQGCSRKQKICKYKNLDFF